ncbi:unnamed protein product, partial [Chironomus riparius]
NGYKLKLYFVATVRKKSNYFSEPYKFFSTLKSTSCQKALSSFFSEKYFFNMGRMHAPGKGISQSALPYRRSVPSWLKLNAEDVKEQIKKLGKKGMTPSQIGIILRDSHGVAQVRFVNGNKILRIMKAVGLKPDIPEDLYFLIKRAVSIRKHLERNRKDIDSKFRLILVESRIHRLARYYKNKAVLPPTWKYESATASALVA